MVTIVDLGLFSFLYLLREVISFHAIKSPFDLIHTIVEALRLRRQDGKPTHSDEGSSYTIATSHHHPLWAEDGILKAGVLVVAGYNILEATLNLLSQWYFAGNRATEEGTQSPPPPPT